MGEIRWSHLLFLQKVHLHFLHVQEWAQEQESRAKRKGGGECGQPSRENLSKPLTQDFLLAKGPLK